MHKYSIIIPSYNAEKTIEKAFESIVNQTCKDFEIIVIDGGSTDSTLSIISKYNKYIKYHISERDNGIYDAMNKGLKQAKGAYIIFLGADDTFYNEHVLSDAFSYLQEEKVYYGQSYFSCKNVVYDGRFHFFKLAMRNICHQAIFYPASIFNKFSFDLKYPLFADYHLNLLLIKHKIEFVYIALIITVFNDQGASAIAKDKSFEQDRLLLIRENLGFLPYLYTRFRLFLLPTQKIVLGWLRSKLQK